MKKICIITPYFGKWPNWFPFYLKSCKFNPTINWILFTDCGKPKNCPKNVKIVDFTLNDFNKLASKKLKLNINIKYPYKICDLRPSFGIIFSDYIKKYDFWGNSDIDIIYGDIRKFVTKDILSKYDIITSKEEYLIGHFTLYKNSKKTNELFKKNQNYKKIFTDQEHQAFDEYNFFKNKKRSMTWTVKEYSKKNYIKSYFKTMYEEYFLSVDKKLISPFGDFIFRFDKGKLLDKEDKECFYIHFFLNKEIKVPEEKIVKNKFLVTNYGIIYNLSKVKHFIAKIKSAFTYYGYKIYSYLGKRGIFLEKHWPRLYYKLKRTFRR